MFEDVKDAKRDRRSWTDSDLAAAVHNARSWRGVLRNLGLHSNGSTHAVKREARRLGLNVGHFGSEASWTDAQLRAAVADAASWAQLLSSLGERPASRRSREQVQARAAQLGLKLDRLRSPRYGQHKPSEEISHLAPERENLRRAAQSLAMAWFMLRGLWPAMPAEPRPYDLLLDTPSNVKRLQVKTTTCLTASGSWQVSIGRHAGGGYKHDQKVPYDPSEADLFVIFDGEFMIYLVPISAVSGRVSVSLNSYRQFIVGSAASIFGKWSPRLPPQPVADGIPPWLVSPGSVEPSAKPAKDVRRTCRGESGSSAGNRPAADTRWTESCLRAAAKDATSWADLLRHLGYQPSSTSVRRSLQYEIQRYRIDAGHFVAQRTWSDQALVEAAATASSWADLLSAIGLSPNSRSTDSVRAAARRLGVELGRFTLGPKTGRQAIGIDLPEKPGLGYLRNAAPSIAAAWFLACGRAVSIPTEPEVYDFVVGARSGLQRVQVKTTTSCDARGNWIVRIGHRPDGSPCTADLVPYTADEVDFFMIVDGDLLLYLVPARVVGGKVSLSLRAYRDLIVGDASSLLASMNPVVGGQFATMRVVA
jgi:hypothetical protein